MLSEKQLERRAEAWRLYYTALLNIRYWSTKVALLTRKKQWYSVGIALVGAIVSLTIYWVGKPWYSVAATAGLGIVGAIVRFTIDTSDAREAKQQYRIWSDLSYDSERLWDEGERTKWQPEQLERVAILCEREKAHHRADCSPQDDDLVRKCQQEIGTFIYSLKGNGHAKAT